MLWEGEEWGVGDEGSGRASRGPEDSVRNNGRWQNATANRRTSNIFDSTVVNGVQPSSVMHSHTATVTSIFLGLSSMSSGCNRRQRENIHIHEDGFV